MTVKELHEVTETETKIILYFDPFDEENASSNFDFNRNNKLCLDAFGGYVIASISVREDEIIAYIAHETKPLKKEC